MTTPAEGGIDLFSVFSTMDRTQLEKLLLRLITKHPDCIDYVISVTSLVFDVLPAVFNLCYVII